MDKKFKTGAILEMVTGGLGVLAGVALLIMQPYAYLWGVVLAGALFELALGAFTAAAGAFALKYQIRSLALAGAILGILIFFPTSLVAILFLALGWKVQPPISAAA